MSNRTGILYLNIYLDIKSEKCEMFLQNCYTDLFTLYIKIMRFLLIFLRLCFNITIINGLRKD